MIISKTDFLKYRKCPEHLWFEKHRPELLEEVVLSDFEKHLIEEGYKVEAWTHKLYSDPTIISKNTGDPVKLTREAIESGDTCLFQATFLADDLYVACDILEKSREGDGWKLIEVKGSTSRGKVKEEYLWDVAFQAEVLSLAGLILDQIVLVRVNKNFIKAGEVKPSELLNFTDLTSEVKSMSDETRSSIDHVKMLLNDKQMPVQCSCINKPRKDHCPAFSFLNPGFPDYSVHDLSRITSKKIKTFVDNGIIGIDEIIDPEQLTVIQANQVNAYQKDEIILDLNGIIAELDKLLFPLYFLDYESFSTAIPMFDGTRPYQQIVFQYSLHVMERPLGELRHSEYLHTECSLPAVSLIKDLQSKVRSKGSVIVWYKTFEVTRNNEMIGLYPVSGDFLNDINSRIYDLRDIFFKQYYVHKNFKGSSSIKDVLPVLAPDLSYKKLAISDGTAASSAWGELIGSAIPNDRKQHIIADLLEYCELDTLAMVRIYEYLRSMVEDSTN